MKIYYKVIEVWCDYPFQDTIDYRYCNFSYKEKPFECIGLKIDSKTSIKEKESFLKKELGFKKIKVVKL